MVARCKNLAAIFEGVLLVDCAICFYSPLCYLNGQNHFERTNMNIDLLKFAFEKASHVIAQKMLTCKMHYFFNEKWFELQSKSEAMADEVLRLDSAKKSEMYYSKEDKTAWYYIKDHSAVISVIFTSSVRLPKIEEYKVLLNDVIENATNSYNVTHNELTGLFSRKAFEMQVKNRLETFKTKSAKRTEVASEADDHFSISLLAFDIDKFKQVNDTYGHLYGNLVLKTFAMRLQNAKEFLQKNNKNLVSVELAHPSGEEFFALVAGRISEENIRSIADAFRKEIGDTSLPSDEELITLNYKKLENETLPPLQERKIKTSVGVATYAGSQLGNTPEDEMRALFGKADTALYRSKAGGRDRVTLSQEILKKCGLVLEHDVSTGVVVLDIGKDVGVLIGQEFRVFPPKFSGNYPYIDDDGRSKITLGLYPKVETCRVEVFNSQDAISFAFVSSTKQPQFLQIDKGSLLEAIPLGHITHLIKNPLANVSFGTSGETPSIPGGKELLEYLQRLTDNSKKAYSAVFSFKNENGFLQKYGSAALNNVLAQLYSNAKNIFGYGVEVGVINKATVCVVGEANATYDEKAKSLISTCNINKDGVEIICGYYSPPTPADKNNFDVPPLYALELAQFTASNINSFKDKNINKFSLSLAESYISEQRVAKNYDGAIVDHKRFKEMGINSATLENNIGLCYNQKRDYLISLECFESAIKLNPEELAYRSNAGTVAFLQKDYEKALGYFLKFNDEELIKLLKIHPYAYVIFALLLEKESHNPSGLFDKDKFINIASEAVKLNEAKSRVDFPVLQQALRNATNTNV